MPATAVLSDLHISPLGPLTSFHADCELAGLLGRLRPMHGVDTLILAGDTFDFLATPDAAPALDPLAVPGRVASFFDGLERTGNGRATLGALGALVKAGTTVIVMPGNHDPELAHPEAASIVRQGCGLSADDRRFQIELGPSPWRTRVGALEVVVGHGHLGDPWNAIDPAMVLHHATMQPPAPLQLPLGSRLVVGAMRAFRERYDFVDALKPETAGVILLLFYLDPLLAMKHLPGASTLGVRAVVGSLRRRLAAGPVLGGDSGSRNASAPATDLDELADALLEAVDNERAEASIADIEDWLRGHGHAATGTLASHGGKRILRAAIRLLGGGGTFFDQTKLSAHDKAIASEHLPAGCGPRVVITGHTHAAREVRFDAHRSYINTGTWSDLIPWPPLGTDEEARAFIEDLEHGMITPKPRLTWALVDPKGARLMTEAGK